MTKELFTEAIIENVGKETGKVLQTDDTRCCQSSMIGNVANLCTYAVSYDGLITFVSILVVGRYKELESRISKNLSMLSLGT